MKRVNQIPKSGDFTLRFNYPPDKKSVIWVPTYIDKLKRFIFKAFACNWTHGIIKKG